MINYQCQIIRNIKAQLIQEFAYSITDSYIIKKICNISEMVISVEECYKTTIGEYYKTDLYQDYFGVIIGILFTNGTIKTHFFIANTDNDVSKIKVDIMKCFPIQATIYLIFYYLFLIGMSVAAIIFIMYIITAIIMR